MQTIEKTNTTKTTRTVELMFDRSRRTLHIYQGTTPECLNKRLFASRHLRLRRGSRALSDAILLAEANQYKLVWHGKVAV